MSNIEKLEQKLAEARAEYHKVADIENAYDLRVRSDYIKELMNRIGELYAEGAEGENLFGAKLSESRYEITDWTNRSRGATREQAVANWNAGVFYVPE